MSTSIDAAELDRLLKDLEMFKERNVLKSVEGAITAGARKIKDAANRNAPRDTGAFSRSHVIRKKPPVRGEAAEIGVRYIYSRHLGLSMWFEYGTSERIQKKTKRRTGRIRPTAYLSKAAASATPEARRKLIKSLDDLVRIFVRL